MDPESSSITITPIANRPGLVELWGEDEVSKFESLLLEATIERGGKQVIKCYDDTPKPSRPGFKGVDIDAFESFVSIDWGDENDEDSDEDPCFIDEDDDDDCVTVEEINKWDREDYSLVVSRPLSGMTQRYTCIWSGGVDSFIEEFIGFMWVAVHGMSSICLATRIDDMERECSHRMLMSGNHPILSRSLFQNGLIGKVEGFVDPDRLPLHHLHQIMKKPFGVVSLISSTTDVHQENGDEAIEEKLKSGLDFDPDETIRTAISTLQHQCNQEFTADDIWVCVVHEGDDLCLQRSEIEKHLAEINNPTTKPFEDR